MTLGAALSESLASFAAWSMSVIVHDECVVYVREDVVRYRSMCTRERGAVRHLRDATVFDGNMLNLRRRDDA